MGYAGQTFQIQCSRGGYTYDPNIDGIAPEMMIGETRNLNLHRGGRETRGGTSKVNTTSYASQLMGIHDYILRSGTQYVVVATADGKIYKNDTTTIKTGLTANKFTSFAVMADTLYICNGHDTVQTWNGSADSTSDITSPAADWTSGNQPKQLIVHGRGNSERLWAFGFKDGSIYASRNGDGKDFGVTYVVKFHIETGDGLGIVAGIDFQDNLIAFGKKQAYIINDIDTNTANWGYEKAAWVGGVAHHRLIVKTPNDVVCMTESGDIYSIIAVQTTGDYKSASIARPAFIDAWLREKCDLSKIDQFHGIYDEKLRAIKFFVVRNGRTECDTALVFFIDRPANEAWMIHDNIGNASGYSASCAAVVRKSVGYYKVYTGDYTGYIWETETTDENDDGVGYLAGFQTSFMAPSPGGGSDPITYKMYSGGRVVLNAANSSLLTLNGKIDDAAFSDSLEVTIVSIPLGTFVLGRDTLWGGVNIVDSFFEVGIDGKRMQFSIFTSNINQGFFISQILIHYKPLGIRMA